MRRACRPAQRFTHERRRLAARSRRCHQARPSAQRTPTSHHAGARLPCQERLLRQDRPALYAPCQACPVRFLPVAQARPWALQGSGAGQVLAQCCFSTLDKHVCGVAKARVSLRCQSVTSSNDCLAAGLSVLCALPLSLMQSHCCTSVRVCASSFKFSSYELGGAGAERHTAAGPACKRCDACQRRLQATPFLSSWVSVTECTTPLLL